MKRTFQPSKLVRKEDMVLEQECLPNLVELFFLIEELKEDIDFQRKCKSEDYKRIRVQINCF